MQFSSLFSGGRPQLPSSSTPMFPICYNHFFSSLILPDYVLVSFSFQHHHPLFSSSSSSVLPHTQGMDCSWGSVGTVPHTMPAFLFLFSFGDSCRALFSSTTTISTSPSSIFTFFLLLNQPSTSTFPGSPLLSFVIFTSFTLTSLSSTDLYFSFFFFSSAHLLPLCVTRFSSPFLLSL